MTNYRELLTRLQSLIGDNDNIYRQDRTLLRSY